MSPTTPPSTHAARWSLHSLLFLASLASACGDSEGSPPESPRLNAARADVRAAVSSNEVVALALHDELRNQPGNLFYSPLGIEAVLGMLYAGSAGETAAQIGTLLHANDDPDAFHSGLGDLLEDLGGDHAGRGYTLRVANRLFGKADLKPSEAFTMLTRDDYRAPMSTTDFSEPEAARVKINAWVADNTQNRIAQLLMPGDITDRSLLALVNAVYFKASWETAFSKSETQRAPFTRLDGSTVSVDMMKRPEAELRRGVLFGCTLVELDYRSGELSFLGLLPDAPNGLPDLETQLKMLEPGTLEAALERSKASVRLPRLQLKARFDLIPTLTALGVTDVFDSALADLSGIDPRREIFVDPFVHESWMTLNEEGTEAAAATAAVVTTKSAKIPISFDHPFLFFIRDNLTGAIIFTGRVVDPNEN